MAAVSRTAQFAKVHKVLKKHYHPVASDLQRPVLEQLLLACCLEDAHYDAAEEAYAGLVHTFFDWNEVRVTSIVELSEVMARLPDPRAAANRIKRVLQSVFEATYAFDLEEWRKKNLGPTIKWLKKLDGTSNFSIAYVVQSALGGHAIPIDSGTVRALHIVELASDEDIEARVVPGLERAIAKSKGVEFGSLLHQLGADFTANPYAPTIRTILLEINPDVKDNLPKRRTRKAVEAAEKPASQAGAKRAAGATEKKTGGGKKKAGGEAGAAGRSPKAAKKKTPSAAARKAAATRKKGDSAKAEASGAKSKKKSATEGLSKRKPR
ncbi:MAG: hypothetical protein JXB62_07190 [Pirellulales bacterium]|nr:hypothetical protein [Pirellulales bacterium]